MFRADIPCSFRGDPAMYQKLHDDVERTIKFCVETEEGIPLNQVTNFQEVKRDVPTPKSWTDRWVYFPQWSAFIIVCVLWSTPQSDNLERRWITRLLGESVHCSWQYLSSGNHFRLVFCRWPPRKDPTLPCLYRLIILASPPIFAGMWWYQRETDSVTWQTSAHWEPSDLSSWCWCYVP